MRAVRVNAFGAPADLSLDELSDPTPGPGEVLVDVSAAGVNFPDLLVTAGTYQRLPALPFVPGKELAGTIAATGPDVGDLAVGDRVASQVEHGAFAERVVVPAAHAVPVPPGLSDESAAALGMAQLTAHFALLRRARLRPGERVLVTGATGDVGRAAVQLAHRHGGRVLAHARSERYADHLRMLGADQVISAEAGDLREAVHAATDGEGVDVVVETVGGEVFRQAMRSVAWEGRLVVVGFAGGEIPEVKAGYLLVKNVSALGLQVSDYRDREPAELAAVQAELMHAVAAGELEAPIAERFRLDDAGHALEAVRRGGSFGKVVLTMP